LCEEEYMKICNDIINVLCKECLWNWCFV
jgi:hypothetical protein